MHISRFMRVILLALTVGLLAACNNATRNINIDPGIVGSGNVVEETREIGDIDSVVLNTAGELTIMQGEADSLVIRADDNILPILTSDVADGVLTLELKPGANGYTTNTGVYYELTVNGLDTVTNNSAGNMRVEALAGERVTLILNGSGDINIGRIDAETADFELASAGSLDAMNVEARTVALLIGGSGDAGIHHLSADTLDARLMSAGDALLAGRADFQQVHIQGSGGYNADELAGSRATLNLSSSGSAGVNVTDTLNVTISGSGSVTYHGEPTVTQQVSSAGQVVQAER